jgi:Zn-dependent protease/tetratricopeptide (TPR) repeat protein
MNCLNCKQTNLPGGVRCVYCGVPFFQNLDFDLTGGSVSAESPRQAGIELPRPAPGSSRKRGIWSTLAVLGLKLKSILLALKFGKILLFLGSMLVYVKAVSTIYGFKFGIGLAVCILIHELGHIVVNKFNRIPTSLPMFIPFLGAYVTVKKFPDNPRQLAECSAGGPAAGLLASLFCLGMGFYAHQSLWYVLAYLGAIINLFNMMAISILDGSGIFTVFSPRIASFVLISLLLIALKNGFETSNGTSTMLLLLICIAGLGNRMSSARDQRYLLASPSVRLRMAFIYVGLCTTLALLGQFAITHAPATPRSVRAGSHALEDTLTSERDAPARDTQDTFSLPIAELGAAASVLIMWPAAAVLLMLAARRRNAAMMFVCCVGFWALCALQIGMGYVLQLNEAVLFCTSLFAAGLAALLFAIYAYMHRDLCSAQGYSLLVAQSLLWAAGAHIILAFAFTAISPVMMAALTLAVTLVLFRWLVPLLAGHLSAGIAESKAAARWYASALDLNPAPDTAAHILKVKAALELSLGHGTEAVKSLQTCARINPEVTPDIQTRVLRCKALMLQDQWPAALSEVESILGYTAEDTLRHRRLSIGHKLLAEMCVLREWFDEAASQTERALTVAIKTETDVNAELLLIRARCRAALGKYDIALQDVAAAEKMSDTRTAAQIAAAVKAQVAMGQQLYQKAISITRDALREHDSSLELTYLQASALLASGQNADAHTILNDLAANYPGDHWGKLASKSL